MLESEQKTPWGLRSIFKKLMPETPAPQAETKALPSGSAHYIAMPDVDKEDLFSRMGGDESMVGMIVGMFVQQVTEYLQELHEAIETKNVRVAVLKSHAIKGAAANISAMRIRLVAADIEQRSKTGDLDTAKQLMPELHRSFQTFQETIKELVQE